MLAALKARMDAQFAKQEANIVAAVGKAVEELAEGQRQLHKHVTDTGRKNLRGILDVNRGAAELPPLWLLVPYEADKQKKKGMFARFKENPFGAFKQFELKIICQRTGTCPAPEPLIVSVPGDFLRKAAPVLKVAAGLIKVGLNVGKAFAGIPGAIDSLDVPTEAPFLEDMSQWVNSTSGESVLESIGKTMDKAMEKSGEVGKARRWTELPVAPEGADVKAKKELFDAQMEVLQSWSAQAKADECRDALKELLPLTKPKLDLDNLPARCGLRPVNAEDGSILWLSKAARDRPGVLY